ncbi:MAG: glycosyltransferase [Candidatus Thermoplasmatota archaeon]|nr:glycosyltransferase [Candidatus Thermoplasmatota archaeon]
MNIYLLVFVLAAAFSVVSTIFYLVNSLRSFFFRDETINNDFTKEDVTIVVPVYKEKESVFREVLQAISLQGTSFIVVGDGNDQPYRAITEEYGGRFILNEVRGGKRKCLAIAMKSVFSPLVMFVDSDTIIPPDATEKLVSKFKSDVGGVGANLSLVIDDSPISYGAEFVERSREVVFKAMSKSGNVMILDGGCAVYRTSIVKPFILSDEFINHTVFGRKSLTGDDRQLTSHVIKSNFRAVKNYDVRVRTYAQSTYKSYIRQQVRWSRAGWYYFFHDLKSGTASKAGSFYTFELIYMYMLPIVFLSLGLAQFFIYTHIFFRILLFHPHSIEVSFMLFIAFFTHNIKHGLIRVVSTFLNIGGISVFGVAVSRNVQIKKKLKVFAYGAVSLFIMFITFFYGLFTIWKQSDWITR